jgi:serine protease AprX
MRSVHLVGQPAHAAALLQRKSAFRSPYSHQGESTTTGSTLKAAAPVFLGSSFHVSPHVRLEQAFIQALSQVQDPEEKAGLVEMLGNARSLNALPQLLTLISSQEDIRVRQAASLAMARIAAATHPRGFTRTQVTDVLMSRYRQCKTEAILRMMMPAPPSYQATLREGDLRRQMMSELKILAEGIAILDVPSGRKLLQQEYRQSMQFSEQLEQTTQKLTQAVQKAEALLLRTLEKRYHKPVRDILPNLPEAELQEIKDEIKIQMPPNEPMSLDDAVGAIMMLQGQQAFVSQLLLGLTDGMGTQVDPEVRSLLRLGLTSGDAAVKARSLELLAQCKGADYATDIHPNLNSPDQEVRLAALHALSAADERDAKQKVLELISPQAFIQAWGGTVDFAAVMEYSRFLSTIALRGDHFAEALIKRALNGDYDTQTRTIALLILGDMTQEPFSNSVTPATIRHAENAIRLSATKPSARSEGDREALALLATRLWVEQKEPAAILAALSRAERSSDSQERETLLETVLSVLLRDTSQSPEQARAVTRQQRLLSVLGKGQEPQAVRLLAQEFERKTGPDILHRVVLSSSSDAFAKANSTVHQNENVIENLLPSQEKLRPLLTALLDDEDSMLTRMLVARIIGLLRDKLLVEPLIAKVRDPLKGQMDWQAERSYPGNPSLDGANMRLNALLALGQLGSAKSLDVMLDTLDNPTLRSYVLEPLGQIAADVNKTADAATLNKVKTRLRQVMESDNTSRAYRAVRISAANTMFQYKDGVDAIKQFAEQTENPNFRRQVLSALISNNYALEPNHADHTLTKDMLYPGLGVERLHTIGLTGKGVEMAIVDGGYVDASNREGFQSRVKLPVGAENPENAHPSMVMTTAAGNGKLKGVAPDATIYSDKWPDFDSDDPMAVYKKIIEGKLRGENNIRVINNSWGLTNHNVLIFQEIRDILKSFKQVVDLAERAGIQLVFAAGNDGEKPGMPETGTLSLFGIDVDKLSVQEKKDLDYILDKVIVVGAVNTQGFEDPGNHVMAEFSSVGDSLNTRLKPTLVAPGADMMVYGWQPGQGNPKQLVNGTSFASPYVSGVVSLLFQKNPNLTPARVREALIQTAVKLPGVPKAFQGAGEIQPEAALALVEKWAAQRSSRRSRADGQAAAFA